MTMQSDAEVIVWLADELLEVRENVPDLAAALQAAAADFRRRLPLLGDCIYSGLDREAMLDEACFAWIAYDALPMSLRMNEVIQAVLRAALQQSFAAMVVTPPAEERAG